MLGAVLSMIHLENRGRVFGVSMCRCPEVIDDCPKDRQVPDRTAFRGLLALFG
jgi:hypothetical protein